MSFRGKVFAFMVQSNQFKFSAYKFSTRHLSKMVTLPVKTSIGCMEFGRQCSAEQGHSLEAKMSKALVKTAIGCNELGGGIKSDQVEEFVKLCMEKGIYDFDTAYMYTGGKSEEIMGNISSLHIPEAFIATKANPWTEKGLKYDSVLEQMNVSLERLKKDCVDLFYLHAPDHATPIEETLEAVNHLYREGKFKSFGLSNYASWEVAEIYYLCKQNNYPLPTFYQGMYNSVTRQVEGELFPCLRRFGIAFYAYNPLAGGLLTGKHRFEDRENSMIQHGRFSGTGPWTDLYLKRYWKKPLFNLIDQLKLTLDSIYGVGKVSLVDASIRWMYHHSKMDGANGDAVIIGASSIKHLRENLESTKQGPLHEDVVKIFEEAWGEIKGDCPLYFR